MCFPERMLYIGGDCYWRKLGNEASLDCCGGTFSNSSNLLRRGLQLREKKLLRCEAIGSNNRPVNACVCVNRSTSRQLALLESE